MAGADRGAAGPVPGVTEAEREAAIAAFRQHVGTYWGDALDAALQAAAEARAKADAGRAALEGGAVGEPRP